MGKVDQLLAAKKACDRGEAGAGERLQELVRDSTGHEINEAMDRSGQGTESWCKTTPGRVWRG